MKSGITSTTLPDSSNHSYGNPTQTRRWFSFVPVRILRLDVKFLSRMLNTFRLWVGAHYKELARGSWPTPSSTDTSPPHPCLPLLQ